MSKEMDADRMTLKLHDLSLLRQISSAQMAKFLILVLDNFCHVKEKHFPMTELQDACAVQATNDSSIVSKSSAELRGYMPDGTIHRLLQHHMKVSRRAPLIHRGYYIRYQAVRQAIARFLDRETGAQIVSVGCGYDDLFYRCFQKEHAPHLFIDIDFPELINKKRVMLENNPLYADVMNSGRYILLGCDLTDLNKLRQLFQTLSETTPFSYSSPTQAISECVLTYMPVHQSNNVLSFFASHFKRIQWVLYEQIYPDYDAFGRQMVRHFAQRKARIHAAFEYPTLHDQIHRLKSCGVDYVRVKDMNGFWSHLEGEERQRVHGLELFDEWEEWYVKCAHYFVAVAQNYPFGDNDVIYQEKSTKSISDDAVEIENVVIADVGMELRRWAHSATVLSNGLVLVFGGSGYPNGSGACLPRLQETVLFDTSFHEHALTEITQPPARVNHSCVSHDKKTEAFLFGGRESPKRLFNDVWRYDASTHKWQVLHANNTSPPARFRHSAVFVPASTFYFKNEGMLIHGGITHTDSSLETLGCMWFYDIVLNTWTCLGSTSPRHSHTIHLIQLGNMPKILLLGGLSHLGDFVSPELITLDPSFDISPVPLNLNLFGTRTVPLSNRFELLVGGVDANIETKRIKLLDKELLRVHALSIDLGKDWMGVMHGVISCSNDFDATGIADLLIVGGGAVCFSMGSHYDKTVKRLTFRLVIP